jgi:hypothetical protein
MIAGPEWTWAADVGRCVEADPDLTPELRKILLTAVDEDPGSRYSSSLELRTVLAAYLERIWPGRPW